MCRKSILSLRHWCISGAPNKPNRRVPNWCNPHRVEKAVFSKILKSRESTNTLWLSTVLKKCKPYLTNGAVHPCVELSMHKILTLL